MRAFADLLDALAFEPQRNGKLRLLVRYFEETPDPARGFALAALTGGLDFKHAKPALLRGLVTDRVDPVLFELSYDYVGDLAETVSLIWPSAAAPEDAPPLPDVVAALETTGKAALPPLIAGWLDRMTPTERWALIKLMTGGLRVGVSARLAKTALAQFGMAEVSEIEELWHGLEPPYEDLFAWLEGRSSKPEAARYGAFRPVMLAHPIETGAFGALDHRDFCAEWKWDGIRVQAVSEGGVKRLYSRTGDDISAAFPDILEALDFDAVLDGELLVLRGGDVASFGDLQKRLNRKTVTKPLLRDYPAAIRAYDLLHRDGRDLRETPFIERRDALENWHVKTDPGRIDLSPMVGFDDWDHLAELRANPPLEAVEGVMLKRRDSVYQAGRPKGPWFKWKRDPFLIDAVLLYAQRGHGKRSSFYSDYTFGVWRDGELVPVGKAYFGFTDEELRQIDKFVRQNTVNRFGPVREVTHDADAGLVLEVAFEGLNRSSRHKSGLAMRFPRVHRIRWDKPPAEADRIETLEALLP